MTDTDHRYPLHPHARHCVTLTQTGITGAEHLSTAGKTLLLQVGYRASRRLGEVTIEDGQRQWRQYLAPEHGTRFINLSGVGSLATCRITCRHGTLDTAAELLEFANPALDDGPLLLLSPHPDDAELAAFGLYSDHAAQSWIATLSAGEKLDTLRKQYIPGLDDDLANAQLRKGMIRAWNSVTTPQLAGVPASQLYCLGYFNDTLSALLDEPQRPQPHARLPALLPTPFRRWNPTPLPNDAAPQHSGERLIADLVALLEHSRPTTVVVTHPELDPHRDHQASARALALALALSRHQPTRVLLYANHLHHGKHFPYGPEHGRTTLPPWFSTTSALGPWQCYSHPLSLERQRQKVVALDSMHDLRATLRLEKRLKRWWNQKVRKNGYHYYGPHDYLQTHIRADELFCWVERDAFVRGMNQLAHKGN
ncbi:PIG-L family deacetylase [Aeromonas simiae]|uniref:PIG-L family deacetylase n=1 Tax=Aeromonas simiae TaxID=218936 RepID=UPI00069451C2|nr:PIG-L family deacetylase [Aeromonas simiae]